jgi:hypothetical protein
MYLENGVENQGWKLSRIQGGKLGGDSSHFVFLGEVFEQYSICRFFALDLYMY